MKTTNLIIGLVVLALAFMATGILLKGVYSIIGFVAPVLLIIALILDKDTIIGFGKWIYNLFRKDWMMGLAVSIGTYFLFPFVILFLLAKAYLTKKVKDTRKAYDVQKNGEWADYEEVDSKPQVRIELPPIKEKRAQTRNGGEYEDLFE